MITTVTKLVLLLALSLQGVVGATSNLVICLHNLDHLHISIKDAESPPHPCDHHSDSASEDTITFSDQAQPSCVDFFAEALDATTFAPKIPQTSPKENPQHSRLHFDSGIDSQTRKNIYFSDIHHRDHLLRPRLDFANLSCVLLI